MYSKGELAPTWLNPFVGMLTYRWKWGLEQNLQYSDYLNTITAETRDCFSIYSAIKNRTLKLSMVTFDCVKSDVKITLGQVQYPLCLSKSDKETGKLVNKSVVYENTEKQNHFSTCNVMINYDTIRASKEEHFALPLLFDIFCDCE